jgi:hypothetical protein
MLSSDQIPEETVPFTSRVALYARPSHPESQRLIPTSHRRIDLLL